MLKGLDINIKQFNELNNADLRIEAEFYQKKYVKLIQLLNNHKCVNLSELVSKPIQTGHTPSMSNSSFYGGTIKFIKTDNLRVNEICPPFANYLTKLGNDEIKRTELQANDIITTIIGATYSVIGRSCIIHEDILPANINQNIAHIRPDRNKILPEFLNVYLNSKYGKLFLEYLSRQMEQVNLNCNEVGMVKVPIFTDMFQKTIETKVKSAYSKKTESTQLYAAAENQLLEELGLKGWQPGNQNVNVKTLKESFLSSGRLDAEYYQSKYEDIEKRLMQFKKVDVLGNLCRINTDNVIPKTGKFYQYIELANIKTNGEISGCTFDLGENLPTRARQVVRENQVIVSSIEGSLQSCALVPKEYDGAFCSTGFYVVQSGSINSETLLILLKLNPIQQLFRKACSGTILTGMNYEQFSNILLPFPDKTIQDDISAKIQKSFALKAESKRLLEEAKMMFEKEIEKGGE